MAHQKKIFIRLSLTTLQGELYLTVMKDKAKEDKRGSAHRVQSNTILFSFPEQPVPISLQGPIFCVIKSF